MRIIKVMLLVLFSTTIFSGLAMSEENVKSNKKGMYWVYDGHMGVPFVTFYQVDTVAQLCYAGTHAGITLVDCAALARRPEWAPIITWVKK